MFFYDRWHFSRPSFSCPPPQKKSLFKQILLYIIIILFFVYSCKMVIFYIFSLLSRKAVVVMYSTSTTLKNLQCATEFISCLSQVFFRKHKFKLSVCVRKSLCIVWFVLLPFCVVRVLVFIVTCYLVYLSVEVRRLHICAWTCTHTQAHTCKQ